MANKSIKDTASLDNEAVTTGYQMKANPVDTFVSGSGNNRGQQVAAALNKVSGSLMNLAKTNAHIEAKIASKKQEQITNLELLRASNAASEFEPLVKEFASTYNYSIVDGQRPTGDQVWEDFTSQHPEYSKALSKLTTTTAKNSLNKAIGNALYSSYGSSIMSFEKEEEDVELSNYAMKALDATTLSASSPEFFKTFKNIDQTIQTTDRSPKEAKALLLSTAERAATESGDYRLYTLLLGEVEGRPSILSNDEFNAASEKREQLLNKARIERNRLDAEKAEGVKTAKATLQSTMGTLFLNGEDTTENIMNAVRAAEQAGVGSAASDADKVLKAYRSLSTETVEAEEMVELYDGYIQAPDKIEWVRQNSGRMDKGLLSTFLTQSPRENPYNSKVYARGSEIIKSLIRDEGIDAMFVEVPRFAPLRLIFEEEFKELSTSPEWSQMSLPQQNDEMFKIIQKIQGYKKLIGEEDFLSPKQIETRSEEEELKQLINKALGE